MSLTSYTMKKTIEEINIKTPDLLVNWRIKQTSSIWLYIFISYLFRDIYLLDKVSRHYLSIIVIKTN